MGQNIKYGEFTFGPSTSRPAGKSVSTAKSTKGIPKSTYDASHAMKDGGYAKGGAKKAPKREPEATVRKEVALLSKAGAPKAMMRKAKAPLTMMKEEMMEPTGMKHGGKAKKYAKGGAVEAKLEKHADMPAGKAHGPGAGNKLAKGGVPSFSKVPKISKMG